MSEDQTSHAILSMKLAHAEVFGHDTCFQCVLTINSPTTTYLGNQLEAGCLYIKRGSGQVTPPFHILLTDLLLCLQVRQKTLAQKLKTLLQPYVDGHKDSFQAQAQQEITRLVDSSFGPEMLHTIG